MASLQMRPENVDSPYNCKAILLTNTIVVLRARQRKAPESNRVPHAFFMELEQCAAGLVIARVVSIVNGRSCRGNRNIGGEARAFFKFSKDSF